MRLKMSGAKLQDINDFFNLKRIAMVGVSRNESDFTRKAFSEFKSRGYKVFPVNSKADSIGGEKCYAAIGDIEHPVDGAFIMLKSPASDAVVRECAAGGIKKIWVMGYTGKGTLDKDTLSYCRENNVRVTDGYCPFMFFKNTAWFHRAHTWFTKVFGIYPS